MNDDRVQNEFSRYETIKQALRPEFAMMFFEIVNKCKLRPEDPEVALACVVAVFMLRLTEFMVWADKKLAEVSALVDRLISEVPQRIAEAFVRSYDDMETDIRSGARQLALDEYRSAAAVRSMAFNDEVRMLQGKITDFERERVKLEAARVAAGGSVGTGGKVLSAGGYTMLHIVTAAAIALVIGTWTGGYLVTHRL